MNPLLDSKNRQQYVLRKKSNKVVLLYRAISNTTGIPNGGSDYEYLPIVTEDVPDYDSTFSIRSQSEGANEETGQWEIHYTVTDKSEADKLAAAENVARNQVSALVPPTQDLNKIVILVLAALLRGDKLTDKENDLKSKLLDFADKLNQNDDNLDSIKSDIQAGQKPDVTQGWVPVEATPIILPTPIITREKL